MPLPQRPRLRCEPRARSGFGDIRSEDGQSARNGRNGQNRIVSKARCAVRGSDVLLHRLLTLTRAAPEGWTGRQGRVDRDMLDEVGWPPAVQPRCYVCGPTPFVEAVADALTALGHDPLSVKTERFGPTGG